MTDDKIALRTLLESKRRSQATASSWGMVG
jgi:hypothetical protein